MLEKNEKLPPAFAIISPGQNDEDAVALKYELIRNGNFINFYVASQPI